jgi:hypothetical protein
MATSSLLGLPQELRDQIHQFLFSSQQNTELIHDRSDFKTGVAQPAITKVNRQLRFEALPAFYQINIFSVPTDNLMGIDVHTAKQWLAAIGPENIRHVNFLMLNGWTRSRLENGWCRPLVRVLFDLKSGAMEVGEDPVDRIGFSRTVRDLEALEQDFTSMLESRPADSNYAVNQASVLQLLNDFEGFCRKY